MGMWGIGVFDNDSALDFVDSVVDEFKRRINVALGLEEREEDIIAVKLVDQVALEDLDSVVLPSAAILIRLCSTSDASAVWHGKREFSTGLLERIASEAIGEEPPRTDDSHLPDAVTNWSAVPPSAKVVGAWRSRTLEAFDSHVQGARVSTDYVEGRPAVIRATFDTLEALAASSER